MKFLVDEDLPRSTVPLLQELGYEAVDVRDVGLRGFPDDQIAAYAKANGFCLVTADGGFANIRQFPPREYPGLVVLDLPSRANLPVILRLLREFFTHPEIVRDLSGKLAIVAFGRVRLREM
jgi:predicted nuclease of predicted toxin-antitoxin system